MKHNKLKISKKTIMKKIKLTKKFKSKPSYDLYIQLWYTLDTYLVTRINEYIFLEYYKWDVTKNNLVKIWNINDINNLKKIYEYDYAVFKVLLFLYWDLECYLEDTDKVKDTLKVNLDKLDSLSIKFKNKVISNLDFVTTISNKESNNFWENLESRGLLDLLLQYNVYTKIYSLESKHRCAAYIKQYKLYKKHNDKINVWAIFYIMKMLSNREKDILYYESYIESWYKEWYSEINIDLSLKYKSKIKHLDLEFNKLLKCFKYSNK